MQTQGEGSTPNVVDPAGSLRQERLSSVRNAIALRVRSDSGDKARLTCGPAVSTLVRQATDDPSFATDFAGIEGFEDIKAIAGASGDVYLYSDRYLSRQEAQNLLRAEETRAQVVRRVRSDSAGKQRLTPLGDLKMIPGAEPGKIEDHLQPLLDDERYKDVKLVSNSRGGSYLYSEDHMTATYATVLARAEANDPLGTIAATVREDSRIYPRPTSLGTFSAPIFNIDVRELTRYAEEVASRPEYADIKIARASNGAIYLYSEQFLNSDWARSTVEWEEVGKYENP
jgi:hypothetical protein